MELREWLIILGLALVTLIVIDGVRRLQRQRRIPRLDEVEGDARGQDLDPEAAAREAEINWELPNGGARVVRPADYSSLQPKPKLERQAHPGPSRVLAGLRASASQEAASSASTASAEPEFPPARETRHEPAASRPAEPASRQTEASPAVAEDHGSPSSEGATEGRREPSLSAWEDDTAETGMEAGAEPLAADPGDHDDYQEIERHRLVDLDGVGDTIKSGSRRMGATMQRFGASLQKSIADRREQKRLERERREQERAEKAAREAEQRRRAEEAKAAREAEAIAQADDDDPLFTPPRLRSAEELASGADARRPDDSESPAAERQAHRDEAPAFEERYQSDVVRAHPVLEKALRHDVSAEHARHALSHAEEIIVISVMSREEEGFSGTALLDLMLACGLRYSRDMGIFHRFETEDPESQLQFSMVNVLKPGTFPIESMDDFRTPGVTLLMPLPGASDTAAAFEAMVETAMVVVRNMGGELKDENQSVMTAQTVEFARQRVQEFERRNRLNRYQVN
ncbi:cell division protein ZipA [Halomonas sp. C05BenzN]|uniref:cell division protein ZipA n=1 Tax=Halomonas sp. C05BenzN TaxID=3411041 RepID=UPI003B9471E8